MYGKGHHDDGLRIETKKLLNVQKACRQVSVFHNYNFVSEAEKYGELKRQ